jgi:hypothetical protein
MTSPLSDLDDREPFETARWKRRDAWAIAAMDTMPQITERILGIVGEGRVINKTFTYVHDGGLEDLGRLDHATGLHKGGHAAHPEGHSVWQRDDQAGFAVYLTHGYNSLGTMEGFSVGAMAYNAATEKEVRARYDRAMAARKAKKEAERKGQKYDWRVHGETRLEEITRVEMHGIPGEPHRNDRIEIEDWNQHGVLCNTIITFVEPDWPDSGRVTETNLVVLGHYKRPTTTTRYQREEDAVVFARFDGPDADVEAARAMVREVQARPETDFVWLAEEQVTRVRNSI